MKRMYICNKHKSYSIRNHYFVNGKFETEDEQVQALIESADGYGVFIHPAETPEEIAEMKAKELERVAATGEEEQESAPAAVQGARGTQSSSSQRRRTFINPKDK